MRIVAFELEDWEKESFRSWEEEYEMSLVNEALDEMSASEYSNAEVISTFIYSRMSSKVLRNLKKLKLIAARSTGVDHIDLAYCQEHGIVVCNVPNYGKHTVAEHAFGLLLVISHRLYDAIERVREGRFSFSGLRGFDLQNKLLGVIGTGEIGSHVIQIAKGFGMQVIASDAKPDPSLADRLGFVYQSMDEVLRKADVLTLHVPATKSTHHLISKKEFDKMKSGIILINTARGSVVDVQALLQALLEGNVAAAGLDVLPEEPAIREAAELLRAMMQDQGDLKALLADYALLQMKNVYVTPHSAFNTREAVKRILETTMQNIRGFLEGKVQNQVNA